ncbi:globin domain-containing protein [Acidimangrovimonas pyrenivorans]|uniref:Globin domain-containing protein n=1 Tax=Acidimangrovimonas pyrenivorans TaxID=2030798 RepID=A0ABV7ALT6_9RHOB
MPVTERQAELIRAGFAQLRQRLEPASVEFYEALFRRRPDLRGMFREDLAGQGMKFMTTLDTVVQSLDAPEALTEPMKVLGHTHAQLGVKAEHFAPMAEALIEVLRSNLGGEFTAEAEAAWRTAYDDLARMLIAGGID